MPTLPRSTSNATPATFAEVPFKTLGACHEDIAAMLDGMSELADRLPKAASDDGLREKARAAHLIFSGQGIEHHLDEERHVFPALLAASTPEWTGLVRKLQQDHALIEARWMKLGPQLHLIARGYHPQHQGLQDEIRLFIDVYRRHMALEDSLVYPCARHLLSAQAVCTMNQEMANRRVKDTPGEHDDEPE